MYKPDQHMLRHGDELQRAVQYGVLSRDQEISRVGKEHETSWQNLGHRVQRQQDESMRGLAPADLQTNVIIIKQNINSAMEFSIKRCLRRKVFGKYEMRKWNWVSLVCFVLHIDVFSVSISFNIRFCIYEHIQNYLLKRYSKNRFRK